MGHNVGTYNPLILVVSPIALDRIRAHLTTVAVLSELGMWFGLELDDVAALAVLDAEDLDVDGAGPVVPLGVLLAVTGLGQLMC